MNATHPSTDQNPYDLSNAAPYRVWGADGMNQPRRPDEARGPPAGRRAAR